MLAAKSAVNQSHVAIKRVSAGRAGRVAHGLWLVAYLVTGQNYITEAVCRKSEGATR